MLQLDVVIVGRSNVDLGLRVAALPAPGQTVVSDEMYVAPGGKAFNQAVRVAKEGGRAALVSNVGDDTWGQLLARELGIHDVATAGFRLVPGAPTGAAVVQVTPDGENTVVLAVSRDTELTADDVHNALTTMHASVVVVQLDLPPEPVTAALDDRGDALLVANLIPDSRLDEAALSQVDLYVVNDHEAAVVLGHHLNDPVAAAKELRHLGPPTVVVTAGAGGAAYATSETSDLVAATAVSAVDTTGAGDAFLGTLALRLARGHTLADAVGAATAAGTAAVQHTGALPPRVPPEPGVQ